MATINLCEVITMFQKAEHYATSYEIYNGDDGTLIDSTYRDEENVESWTSQLSRGDGTHYRDVSNLRARFKMHYRDGSESEWYELDSYDQTAEKPIIHKCENDMEEDNG